ncbi:beta-1,3-galactosyltransferase 5-like [Ixodes scapularis]|uniref:beta-1,3-galactosyltransferase 5-like n=1 Tax=Ixodes scapularis TaxID=6945 RepID=UPI001A9EDAE6|nr:beta-1,3-galactosyltransferase 5-like [Ixodes scapularis]
MAYLYVCVKVLVASVLLTAIAYVIITMKMAFPLGHSKISWSFLWINIFRDDDLDINRTFYLPSNYTINVEDLCHENANPAPIELLVLVATAPKNVQLRDAIRQTYGRDLKSSPRNKVAFVLGRTTKPALERSIRQEQLLHSDIIQADFIDTYNNLTIKSVAMLRWACIYCPQAQFVAKLDDDTFLNVPNFLRVMKSLPRNTIYGKLFNHTKPIRDHESPWRTSYKEYPAEYYPDLISGTCYVIGGDVLRLLYKATGTQPPFRLEDVLITGLSAESVGIPRVGVPGFNSVPVRTVCEMRDQVTSHYMTPKAMRDYYKALKQPYLKC